MCTTARINDVSGCRTNAGSGSSLRNGMAPSLLIPVQLHTREWLGGPWTEAVQRKRRLPSGLHVDQDVVVFLLRTRALPILIGRVIRRNLDMRSTRQDRVLLGATAAQQQIFHAVYVVNLRRMHVSVEHNDVEILRVGRQNLVRILSVGDGAHTRASERRVVEGDEHLA